MLTVGQIEKHAIRDPQNDQPGIAPSKIVK